MAQKKGKYSSSNRDHRNLGPRHQDGIPFVLSTANAAVAGCGGLSGFFACAIEYRANDVIDPDAIRQANRGWFSLAVNGNVSGQ